MAAAVVAVPFALCSVASWGCCAVSTAGSLCCSLASCFGCKYNARLARLVYLFMFMASAVLAIMLRYWGQAALANVAAIASAAGACTQGQCWGAQAAYRVSFALAVFFAAMAALTAAVPVTHLGGWLVKLLLHAVLLGLSFLVPNADMQTYAEVARAAAVVFLLVQVLIIIDAAYKTAEWLVARADAHDAASEYTPGLCTNAWRIAYAAITFGALGGAAVGLGILFAFFGGCPLNNFFTAQTLIVSVAFLLASALGLAGRGLLPPALIAAYNVYLTYAAITNNPEPACNALARAENSSQASIIAGLVIAVLSVSWVAVSSAGSVYSAISTSDALPATRNPAAAVEWRAGAGAGAGAGAVADGAAPASYQGDAEAGAGKGGGGGAGAAAPAAEPSLDADLEPRPWLFHVVMLLAAMYLAMMTTNWGAPSATNVASGSPELSNASMWARMGSVFVIEALFAWTLIAPRICPDRDFGM